MRSEVIQVLTETRDPEFAFARQYLEDVGIDVAQQPKEARAFLETQAAAGRFEAQVALAKLLLCGLVGEIDRSEALRWCEQGAAAEYGPALVLLASFYAEGWAGIVRDGALAVSLLERAASAGYAHAASLLATMYSEGIQVPMDRERARGFLVQAAQGGLSNSQFELGNELLKSTDRRVRAEGVRWIQSAAASDLPSAHRLLGELYRVGDGGLPRDASRSRFHQRRADELSAER